MSSPLYRFAKLLEIKYLTKNALSQSLQEILEGAASSGATTGSPPSGPNGIMNFPLMLKTDHAKLNFAVTVKSKMFGGNDIEITDWKFTPSSGTPEGAGQKYNALPQQIKNYLSKHVEYFDVPKDYPVALEYGAVDPEPGIASK